jgi:hypothetical protein
MRVLPRALRVLPRALRVLPRALRVLPRALRVPAASGAGSGGHSGAVLWEVCNDGGAIT